MYGIKENIISYVSRTVITHFTLLYIITQIK